MILISIFTIMEKTIQKQKKNVVCFKVLGKICKFCMMHRVKPWLIQISFDKLNSGKSKYLF